MYPPKVQPDQYIDFLLATPKACSATEAQRVQPARPRAPAHDAFTRLLHRLEPDPQVLWREVQPLVAVAEGVLVIDDTTLDKPYAQAIAAVTRHWSGKHHAVVQGINLISLVWTDGDRVYPCDYRIYHKAADGQTKNDHFVTLLTTARTRGFRPRCVLFDGWYASLANLKLVRDFGWTFLTRLKSNRLVRWGHDPARPLADQPIAATGSVVWRPGYGSIRVFRLVAPDGDTTHWATNDLGLDELTRQMLAEWSWQIEEYHRGIKQFTGIERCQARSARAQRNHIGLALRAFLRLEWHRFTTGWSWFEAKWQIVREAVRQYLACPRYRLPEPSTA
jgi:hypothetical protein